MLLISRKRLFLFKKCWLTIIALCIGVMVCWSQNFQQQYKFEQIHVGNGLSHNYTTGIVQDHQGFIWIGTLNGLQRFDGQKFTTFINDPNDTTSIAKNSVDYLEIDSSGQLLIGFILEDRLDQFDFKTETFEHNVESDYIGTLIGQDWSSAATNKDSTENSNNTQRLLNHSPHPHNIDLSEIGFFDFVEMDNGTKWLATNVGLYQMAENEKSGNWWLACNEEPQKKIASFNVYEILADENENHWLATDKGLYIKSSTSDCIQPFRSKNNQPFPFEGIIITSIAFDQAGKLWIGSYTEGFYVLDINELSYEFIQASSYKDGSPIKNLAKIFFDQAGNGWFLTGYNGLFVLHANTNQFQWFVKKNKSKSDSNSSSALWTVFEDHNFNLWYLGNKITTNDKSIPSKFLDQIGSCYDMEQSSDGVYWFCSAGNGVNRLNTQKDEIQTFFNDPIIRKKGNAVTAKFLDHNGDFWAGFWGGAAGHMKTNDLSNPVAYPCDDKTSNSEIACYIQCVLESKDGKVWFGSAEAGFSVFDPKKNTWKSYGPNDGRPNGLKHIYVRCMVEDLEGMIWLGTYGGGLYRFDPNTEVFKHFGTKNGLPDEVIEELQIDKKGLIWILTTKRLTRLDPSNETFQTFDEEDGMPGVQFHRMSYAKESSGKMYISTDQGYVDFHPDSIRTDTIAPNTAIVKMVRYRNGDSGVEAIEENGLNQMESVDLSYLDYIVRFEIAPIKFYKASKTTIEYKLDGFQNDWIPLDESRQVSFTSLPAGSYTLMVRSANSYGVWDSSPASIELNVSPPWWKTWWAYFLYLLMMAATAWYFWKREMRRLRLQNELEKEQLEANQLRELDQTKSRFFSNISHEFRTPLTVILGMTDEIEKPVAAKTMIHQSGQNLLRLINQMLDISKMDAGKLELKLKTGDLVPYLEYILQSFESLAIQKEIDLIFQANSETLKMKFDDEKVQHIIFNLLSNAIKFTPNGGQIKLMISQSNTGETRPVTISLTDSGIGIPSEDVPFVFDRYFQAKNSKVKSELGTGIGLSFSKELVELMNGKISVKSALGSGSTFTIELPYIAPNLENGSIVEYGSGFKSPKEVPSALLAIDSKNSNEVAKPSLLLIEDNPQVVKYISLILEQDYDIITAENGEKGIEMALELIPDIIISDVMMPIMDGFEVTHFLKNDERTSHIPIILLTAKAGVEARLEGIDRGADAYLAKPFLKKELILRLSKMIELRKNLQSRYKDFLPTSDSTQKDVQIEDAFLTKIRTIIEANLSEAEFGVNELCKKAGLSQSQLFRKLKALTNKSTSAYLRGFRLHIAKTLLEKGALNVSEVAYAVGFNDPLYFSRVFSKEYGVAPKDVI